MNSRLFTFASLLFSLIAFPSYSARTSFDPSDNQVPPIVTKGIDTLVKDGVEAAIKVWSKGSLLEGEKSLIPYVNGLKQIQEYYGKLKAYHVIDTRNLGPSVRMVWLAFDYAKGPCFFRFVTYRPEQEWIVADFSWEYQPEKILPASVFGPSISEAIKK